MENFLTGQKDADLIILGNLKDREVIEICLVNKSANVLCNNEEFWRNRFIKKWGKENVPLKMKDKTWKKFYLLILKYTEISSDKPLNILDINSAMNPAAENGHIDIIKLLLKKGGTNFNGAFLGAAKGGHLDIVKLISEKDRITKETIEIGFKEAVKNGYIDIVKFILENLKKKIFTAYDLNDLIDFSKKYKNKEIIGYYLKEAKKRLKK